MWRLCVLCVLLSSVSVAGNELPLTPTSANANSSDAPYKGGENHRTIPAGAGPGASNHTDIYPRLGSEVLLPLTYNLIRDEDPSKCDWFEWIWRPDGSTDGDRITKSKRCERPKLNVQKFPNYNVSQDGRLTISNVTKNDSGNYLFTVGDCCNGLLKHNHSYTLHVQVPVSELYLNVSCLQDGGATIICGINSGDKPSFSISVNGHSLRENSSRTVENAREVHVPMVSPRPWNITCAVENRVSRSEIKKSQVKCAVPVSAPVLVVSCLHNGSLEMSCSVENGSDPMFSLSVNGTYLLANYTKEEKRVNVTTLSFGPWDAHCSVGNSLMWKKTSMTYPACPVPPTDPILKFLCHNGSLEIICFVEKGSDLMFSLSVNGTSFLNNVTSEQRRVNVTSSLSGTGDVHCYVGNSIGKRNTTSTYPTCPVPLSVPVINVSCQLNGIARAICEVEEGSNTTFTWTVNGKLIHQNSAPSLIINASHFASGAINVTCSAENSVSREQSNETEIFCDAPVSEPVLNASCLSNGNAVIACWLLSGTNPEFSLTVNGQVMLLPNISSSLPLLKHIISSGGPWNISCSVGNKLVVSMTNISSHSCSGSSQATCMSCLQKSVIGGVVALIVTTSPLLIAGFYIGRNTRQDQ